MKIQIVVLFVSVLLSGFCSCNKKEVENFALGKNNFNKDWMFVKDIDVSVEALKKGTADTLEWEKVSLPHTANVEPLVIKGAQWQGNCIYQKQFEISKSLYGKTIALYFEGAMQVAEVYINGVKVAIHKGGYLPFYVDITKQINYGENNTVVVKLNNEDNKLIPPGKNVADLDFNIYSGIYRNVWLEVKNPIHITDVNEVDHVAGGGIFVTYQNVSRKSALVNIKTDVINTKSSDEKVGVEVELWKDDNLILKESVDEVVLNSNKTLLTTQSIQVENPELWSPDSPFLYRLVVKAVSNGEPVDIRELKIGIHSIKISATEGFKINGEKLKLRGTNRHQEYPYIGYALSDNANYRDAWKIKAAGFNFVRLSHYPQSQSFLAACDELGILVMDAIPGWQFFGNEEFQKNAFRDIRDMVRADRNHPSIIIWESSLNESGMDHEFMDKANAIIHEELPGNNVYTSGWIDYAFDVFIPARQHAKPPYYWNKYDKDKPLFIAEYGDWEYYAQNAGFNQKEYKDLSDEERNSRQLRAYGQRRMVQQALNYQEAHNSNLAGPAIGDANWLMFDYNRGYAPDLEASGIMDIFRLPKFAFYFYKSQTDIGESSIKEFSEPFVFIANFYNDPSFLEVKIFSNCEEVELIANGESLGKQKPDSDANSTGLKHPPFTFTLPAFSPGEMIAKGYVAGKVVAESVQKTPGEPKSLKLWMDKSGKDLERGCNDIVFIYAAVTDEQGTICPLQQNSILFTANGDAALIGANPAKAEAGVATILLKAGNMSNSIEVSATAKGLDAANLQIMIK